MVMELSNGQTVGNTLVNITKRKNMDSALSRLLMVANMKGFGKTVNSMVRAKLLNKMACTTMEHG